MPTATTVAGATENESVSQKSDEPATMLLTSAYGQTMPTVVTTQFNLTEQAITTGIDLNPSLTTMDMSIPDVFTSQIVTEPTTSASPNSSGTEPDNSEATNEKTTTRKSEEPTSPQKVSFKSVETNAQATTPDGDITFDFDPAEWNGGVKTKKISIITVEYEGKTKTVTGSVLGLADDAGNAKISVLLGDLKIPEGTTVNITIPAGAVVSKKGDQQSNQMTASVVYTK